jgi:hypothetical protein
MLLLQALIGLSIQLITVVATVMVLGTISLTISFILKKKKVNKSIAWRDLFTSLGKGLAYAFMISVLFIMLIIIFGSIFIKDEF